MAKTRYLVTRAGVLGLAVGSYIERETLHPSLEAHVIPAPAEEAPEVKLEVGKPLNAAEKKAIIGKRLEELQVPFSPSLSVEKMLALLPAGEAELMFPSS